MMEQTTVSLYAQYEKFKLEHPKVRIRDAAKALGVTEAELVAISPQTIRLRDDIEAILLFNRYGNARAETTVVGNLVATNGGEARPDVFL